MALPPPPPALLQLPRRRLQEDEETMTDRLPTFYGYTKEYVREFLDDLESYFAAKGTVSTQWLPILAAQLRGPAREAYRVALTDVAATGLGGLILEAKAAAGNNPPAAALATTHWEVTRAWLEEKYFTEQKRESIKEHLFNMKMSINQCPEDWVNTIDQYMQLCGETSPVVREMVFMNGLPADIQRHIKRFGPRSMEEKVRMAQAFWDTEAGHSASLYDKLPQDLCRKFSTGIPVVQMVSASAEPPEEDTIKPTVMAKTGKTTHEDEMEKITKMFSEMTAHIADLEAKVIRQNRQPRGTFVAEERNRGQMNCFLCGRRC